MNKQSVQTEDSGGPSLGVFGRRKLGVVNCRLSILGQNWKEKEAVQIETRKTRGGEKT